MEKVIKAKRLLKRSLTRHDCATSSNSSVAGMLLDLKKGLPGLHCLPSRLMGLAGMSNVTGPSGVALSENNGRCLSPNRPGFQDLVTKRRMALEEGTLLAFGGGISVKVWSPLDRREQTWARGQSCLPSGGVSPADSIQVDHEATSPPHYPAGGSGRDAGGLRAPPPLPPAGDSPHSRGCQPSVLGIEEGDGEIPDWGLPFSKRPCGWPRGTCASPPPGEISPEHGRIVCRDDQIRRTTPWRARFSARFARGWGFGRTWICSPIPRNHKCKNYSQLGPIDPRAMAVDALAQRWAARGYQAIIQPPMGADPSCPPEIEGRAGLGPGDSAILDHQVLCGRGSRTCSWGPPFSLLGEVPVQGQLRGAAFLPPGGHTFVAMLQG